MNILLSLCLLTQPPASTIYTEKAELGFVTLSEMAGVGADWKSYALILDEHPDRGGDPRHVKHWTALFGDKREEVAIQFDGQKVTSADLLTKTRSAKRCRVEVDRDNQRYGAVTAVRVTSMATEFQKPVLVKVTAGWCPPCVRMKGEFGAVLATVMNRFEVKEVDCTVDRGAGQPYGVSSLPTVIVYQNGKEVNRISGYVGKDQLEQWLVDSQKEVK